MKESLPDPLVPSRPPTWSERGRRIWLYPERRDGPIARRRRLIAWPLLFIYLIVPFIEIHGRPIARFDVTERMIFILGRVFRFNDGPYLWFVFVSLALTVFLVTALKGRFWCSYACPQTVFLEWIVRPIEEFLEGNASERRKKEGKPWTFSRVWRRAVKVAAFITVAGVLSHIFLAYFIPPQKLFAWILNGPSEHMSSFVVGFGATALLSFDFIYFREQFCSVLCPYMRFQSVLMDQDTPVVSYDSVRGEPRAQGGDCIDCDLCVKVCPTGIDIRNGLQLECIQCGRCADACDTIMVKAKKPKGLVRVDSIRNIRRDPQPKGIRWRPIVYGTALAVVLTGLITTLGLRQDVALTFLRQPGPAYSQLDATTLGNVFNMRVENNSDRPLELQIELLEPAGVKMICVACGQTLQPFEQRLTPLVLSFPSDQIKAEEAVLRNSISGRLHRLPLIYPQTAGGGR